ncbi:ABC transporter permease [Chloroflexota bacterium]
MSLKRVSVLLGKELLHGSRGYVFILSIVMPLVLSLLISLLLGSLFSGVPKLGVADEGGSQLVGMLQEQTSVSTREYDTGVELRQGVENGAVDIGVVFPAGFDDAVKKGERVEVTAYTWGESLAKSRTIISVTMADVLRELSGQESLIDIETIVLGDEAVIPWGDRLLPMIVLLTVFLGGSMVPSVSIMNEKAKNTLVALTITPTTIGDVLVAKGIVGFLVSVVTGVLILILNQAFGAQPLLLVMTLALGAVMAVELGLITGLLLNNIATLFSIWKTAGIFLWGPSIIYMFPNIPQWIARVFPTYYLINPIIEISQNGAGWPEVATNIFILIGLDVLMVFVVRLALKKTKQLAA